MRKFSKVDISERELEDIVRHNTDWIEKGLAYVDHQRSSAGGRLDVLLVDSGKALVVAELKVTQDDGMLLQALDYYDDVSKRAESLARQYRDHAIDPVKNARLILVAPTFSQVLVNRCKWLDVPLSLFTYGCGKFDGDEDLVAIFTEQEIPEPVERVEIPQLEGNLNYITDEAMRKKARGILEETKTWSPGKIDHDPIKGGISLKVNNRVFAYLNPRRQHFIISTYDADDVWKGFPIKSDDDLIIAKRVVKDAKEKVSTW